MGRGGLILFFLFLTLTHLIPLFCYYTFVNIRKRLGFWCFQGVLKETSGMKQVNQKKKKKKKKKKKRTSKPFLSQVSDSFNFTICCDFLCCICGIEISLEIFFLWTLSPEKNTVFTGTATSKEQGVRDGLERSLLIWSEFKEIN